MRGCASNRANENLTVTTQKGRVLIRENGNLKLRTRPGRPSKTVLPQGPEAPVMPDGVKESETDITAITPTTRGKVKTEESGSSIVARAIAPQLASAPTFLVQQLIDERKLAVLNELVATALGYFSYRGSIDRVRFYAYIADWELVASQAIGGLARRHILQAIANSSGVSSQQIAERPNILARNVWRRDWKSKAVQEGKQLAPGED